MNATAKLEISKIILKLMEDAEIFTITVGDSTFPHYVQLSCGQDLICDSVLPFEIEQAPSGHFTATCKDVQNHMLLVQTLPPGFNKESL